MRVGQISVASQQMTCWFGHEANRCCQECLEPYIGAKQRRARQGRSPAVVPGARVGL